MREKSWSRSREHHFLFERPVMVELYASVWLIKGKNKAPTEELAVFLWAIPGICYTEVAQ